MQTFAKQIAPQSDYQRRLQLVARVQIAYETLRDLTQQRNASSPRTQTAIAHARLRLRLLNRALALVALQGTAPQQIPAYA